MDYAPPTLGDSYWSTTAQLLAADAADSDEEIIRALSSGGSSDADSTTSTVSSPVDRLLATADALALTPPPPAKWSPTQEEARRMRDRLKVRRLYYRKLDRLNELRAQVSALEEQLETQQRLAGSPGAPGGGGCKAEVAQLLQEFTSTRQQLQHENEYLRRVVERFVRCVHSVSVKLVELREPPAARLRVKPMTRQACTELQRRSLAPTLESAQQQQQLQQVGSTCGWERSQLVLDDEFRFRLEKRVPGAGAERVAELTWGLLSTPVRFARLYSLAVEMKCHVLQVVDADNVVMLHEHRTMDPAARRELATRTVVLLSRARTPAGHAISLSSLERDAWVLEDLAAPDAAVAWNEVFWRLQYADDATRGGCACSFAGASSVVGESVNFWMTEFVQLAVRWEAEVFGSAAYVLPSGDDGETEQHE